MPVPASTARTVIRGTGIGSEIWQTGFWWETQVIGAITSLSDFQAFADAVEGHVNTFWTAIKSKVYTSFSYVGTGNYWYTGGSTATFAHQKDRSPSAGTLNTTSSPVDTCAVVSLRTQNSGRSARGRMYLPRHEVVQPSTGLFSTVTSDYSTAVANLLHNMAVDASFPTLMRQVSLKNATKGILTAILCDQLPDVQRRRQNRMGKGTISTATPAYS